MSRKNAFGPSKWVDSVAVTAAVTITNETKVDQVDWVSFKINWAGGSTPVFDVQIQGTYDGINWHNAGTAVSVSGASGSGAIVFITRNQVAASTPFWKMGYIVTYTSGSANVTIYISGGCIGA